MTGALTTPSALHRLVIIWKCLWPGSWFFQLEIKPSFLWTCMCHSARRHVSLLWMILGFSKCIQKSFGRKPTEKYQSQHGRPGLSALLLKKLVCTFKDVTNQRLCLPQHIFYTLSFTGVTKFLRKAVVLLFASFWFLIFLFVCERSFYEFSVIDQSPQYDFSAFFV